jgi:hypothetical protein
VDDDLEKPQESYLRARVSAQTCGTTFRMFNEKSVTIEPHQDRVLSIATLGERWDIHPKVALKRAKQLGLPIVRFNARSFGVKLSAVLKAEQEATVTPASMQEGVEA